MQWLLEDIRPNYHSSTDFRKNNPAGWWHQKPSSQ
jgi:hypothetical protein